MERVLGSTRFNGTTTTVQFGDEDSTQLLTAQSCLALTYPIGTGEGGFGSIFSKDSAGTNPRGPRFLIDHNSGTPRLFFGCNSTGVGGSPQVASNTAMTYGEWWSSAYSWDGTAGFAAIKLYQGKSGVPVVETAYTGGSNGAGSATYGPVFGFSVGNRNAQDRTFNGDIAFVARWNRVLSLAEFRTAQTYGPLAVPGLVFCWANGRDYGPFKIKPTNVRVISSGLTPPVFVPLLSRRAFAARSPATCALTGTVTTATETDIVTGGKTIILTLTNDTWVASGATFDAQRQNIIDGIDSAQAEAAGWDATVKATQGVAGVVRTSNTVVTITLDAQATYNITATETITATVPATALTGGSAIIATPTFDVTPVGVTGNPWNYYAQLRRMAA